MIDFHIKLKKLIAGGVNKTQAKLLLGAMYPEDLQSISKKERDEITIKAGLDDKNGHVEIQKGIKLAKWVEVKPECWDKVK